MSESYIFDFSIPKNFLRFLNIYYNVSDMNGAVDKFEFVLASYSQDNIEDCLTDKNMLGDGVTIHSTVKGGLFFEENDGLTVTIKTATPVTFNIGNDIIPLKALFIRDASSKVVFMYCINVNPFSITNSFIIDSDVILYTETDSEYKV